MDDTEIQHQRHRTLLIPRFNDLLCFDSMCGAEKVSDLINLFLQPQVASGFSGITGIWAPMEVEKNFCQRLADQVSSRRWDLICPSQLIGLKKRIRLGASSSWDSSPTISVRSTESSTVNTMRCCERSLHCSARHESGNTSLRSGPGRAASDWVGVGWPYVVRGWQQYHHWRQSSHPTQRKPQRVGWTVVMSRSPFTRIVVYH